MNKYTREIMNLLKDNFEQVVGKKEFQNSSEARSFYLSDLADNLYEPMGKDALKAYGQGSGNEIASGKMNALRSSSALTYNLFGNNPAIIENKKYSVEFEKQYHTLKHTVPGKPANLDAFLYCEETAEAIACEMKMMEWIFNKPGKLRSKYLDADNYIDKNCANVFIPIAEKLISDKDSRAEGLLKEYSCKFSKYDAFQMFKHALACYSACKCEKTREIKKLTLVNCVWTLPVPDSLSPKSRDRYIKEETCEHNEFKVFKELMEPVQKLFKNIGVDFDIQFYTFNDFLSLLNKTEDELNYLKRYTFN